MAALVADLHWFHEQYLLVLDLIKLVLLYNFVPIRI